MPMPYGFGGNHGGYTCQQNGTVVLSSGRRKHLNLLIEDQCKENAKTYHWDYPPTGYTLGLARQRAQTAPAKPSQGQDPGASVSWDRTATTPSPRVDDEQLTIKVGGKRTPSGNFFGTINSALVEKQNPPNYYAAEDLTQSAVETLKTSRRLGKPQQAGSDHLSDEGPWGEPSPSGGQLYQFSPSKSTATSSVHQAATAGRAAPWLMPWQTGDRRTGRIMAEAVKHKRTPLGNFAVLALAKTNK